MTIVKDDDVVAGISESDYISYVRARHLQHNPFCVVVASIDASDV